MERPPLSIVLPTYNERENILGLIDEILEVMPETEVIVVDDDSPDRSWQVVQTRGAKDPRVRCLHRVGRRGLPSAIAEGIAGARGAAIAWMDADGSMPPHLLPELCSALKEADIALASRYAPGGRDARGSSLRVGASRLINGFASCLLGGGVRDWTSGYLAVRREGFERVPFRAEFAYGEYCVDFLYRATRAGLRIREVPYISEERRAGHTKTAPNPWRFLRLGVRYGAAVLRLRFGRSGREWSG